MTERKEQQNFTAGDPKKEKKDVHNHKPQSFLKKVWLDPVGKTMEGLSGPGHHNSNVVICSLM